MGSWNPAGRWLRSTQGSPGPIIRVMASVMQQSTGLRVHVRGELDHSGDQGGQVGAGEGDAGQAGEGREMRAALEVWRCVLSLDFLLRTPGGQ